MLENFASIEEKIQHLNSPIFILDGVYFRGVFGISYILNMKIILKADPKLFKMKRGY